jgi:hypothetical protein
MYIQMQMGICMMMGRCSLPDTCLVGWSFCVWWFIRCAPYSTLDSFIQRFQVAYDACTDEDQRMSLVRDLHVRLEAPLRARLERMYPALASTV